MPVNYFGLIPQVHPPRPPVDPGESVYLWKEDRSIRRIDEHGNVQTLSAGITVPGSLDAALAGLSSGQTLTLAAGTFQSASSKIFTTPNVHIRGAGRGQTIIELSGASKWTLAAANIALSDLSIVRSGSNVGAVLHCSVSGFSTIKDGLMLRNVELQNASGMACGTWHGDAYGCRFYGIVAIDYLYGGRLYDCEVVGHDPALAQTSYGIKTAQSLANLGGFPAYKTDESDRRRKSLMSGGRLINTDPNGVGINGVTETPNGDRLSDDWFHNGHIGQPAVSWFPVPLIGVYILSPQPRTGSGPDNQGSINRNAIVGTGGALRGTLRIVGCEVYGFQQASYLHDSDIIGGMWVCEDGSHQLMIGIISCSFVGISFIYGENKLGTTDGLRRMDILGGVTFGSCHFQGVTDSLMEGNQFNMYSCDCSGFDGIFNCIGWNDQSPLAVRLNGTSTSHLRTGGPAGAATSDYALATCTFECWFRCNNSQSTDARIFGYEEPGIGTGYTLVSVTASTGAMYAYAGGVLIANLSSQTFADSAWHHVAITVTGGTGTLWIDGANKGSAASVTMGGTSGFRIGADGASANTFKGDVTEIRISNAARYSAPFTPKRNFLADANTVSLWGDSTRKQFGWTDQMALHDLDFEFDKNLAPNIPFWVLRDRAYLLQ